MSERLKFGPKELKVGDNFSCEGSSLELDSSIGKFTLGGEIEDIRGGGFFGRTILLKDQPSVIKTTEPDSWHLLWRRLNWDLYPFPSQSDSRAALADHLSCNIIKLFITGATESQITTPASMGFSDLGSLGFAQILERMKGRGAHFSPTNENQDFTAVRQKLWQLGVSLGLEQAAQIHPDNPFGKPNIWKGENGQWIWLDTLPAIPHKGFIFPSFYFSFHKDVRRSFRSQDPTFNRIHTDRLRNFLSQHSELVAGEDKERLEFLLTAYDQITREIDRGQKDRKNLLIQDALKRGVITESRAVKLDNSSMAYNIFLGKTVLEPAFGTIQDFIKNHPFYRLLFDEVTKQEAVQFLHDPNFRQQKILAKTFLRGIQEAYHLGLIDQDALQEAWEILDQKMAPEDIKQLIAAYLALQTWYTISGNIINALSYSTFASIPFTENPGQRLAVALFIEFVLPSLVRLASTATVNRLSSLDLSTAVKVSALPKVGGYLALPADFNHRFGKPSEEIWHYTKRLLIASLSKMLRPWGGWNSDFEAQLWDKLKAEKW